MFSACLCAHGTIAAVLSGRHLAVASKDGMVQIYDGSQDRQTEIRRSTSSCVQVLKRLTQLLSWQIEVIDRHWFVAGSLYA